MFWAFLCMPVLLSYTSFGFTFAVYVFVQQNISVINSRVVDNRDMARKLTFDVPFSTRYSARRLRRLWQFLSMTDGITKCECQIAALYLLHG